MSSIPSISQATPTPNPVQPGAQPPADSTDNSKAPDFAGTLNAAGGKPARKPTAKQQGPAPTGSVLPANGNQPPPSSVPAAAAGSPPSGSAANSSTGAGTVSKSSAASPSVPPAPAPPITTAAAEELAATTAFAATPDLRSAPPSPGIASASTAASTPQAVSVQTQPASASTQNNLSPVFTSTPPMPTSAAPPGPTTKVADPADREAQAAAATSAPTLVNAAAVPSAQAQASAPNAADTGAAAQAAMAAAIAQGTSAPAPDSSAASDDLATPDTGVTLQGVAAANEAAAPLPAGPAARAPAAATSMSVTAASAASLVQAATAAADSGPTDKHSRDDTQDGSVGAAQLLTTNAVSDTAPGPTPTFKVSAGVDTAEFGQGVADRVSLMMDSNLTSAKLQVNPPALGPIEVRIALQGGHAQVWMSSHSAVTRDALEATSPKLREMLGSQGFAQVSVDISQRSFQDRTPQPKAYESVSSISGGSAASAPSPISTARMASGLLDAYA